jgi:hypothetical protein
MSGYFHEMKCCICDRECVDVEFLRRHVAKSHKSSTRDYVLQFELSGSIPKCACGCGSEVTWHQPSKRFNSYVHGHHAYIREKSNDEKQRIGSKNSVKMTQYMHDHPDIAVSRGVSMRAAISHDGNIRRIAAIHAFWATNDPATHLARKEASDRALHLIDLGIIGPQAPFKTEWKDNPFTGEAEYMHCSWESLFLDCAIAANVPFTKRHGIRIPYMQSDGSQHAYIPDFASSVLQLLCEVKGEEDDTDHRKYAAAEEWCARAVDWTYVVLRSECDIKQLFTDTLESV